MFSTVRYSTVLPYSTTTDAVVLLVLSEGKGRPSMALVACCYTVRQRQGRRDVKEERKVHMLCVSVTGQCFVGLYGVGSPRVCFETCKPRRFIIAFATLETQVSSVQ